MTAHQIVRFYAGLSPAVKVLLRVLAYAAPVVALLLNFVLHFATVSFQYFSHWIGSWVGLAREHSELDITGTHMFNPSGAMAYLMGETRVKTTNFVSKLNAACALRCRMNSTRDFLNRFYRENPFEPLKSTCFTALQRSFSELQKDVTRHFGAVNLAVVSQPWLETV
jgi:hypothetical protein